MIRRRLLVAIFITCSYCSSGQDAFAQTAGLSGPWRRFSFFENPTPHPAVVRVIVAERDATANGSGSFVSVGSQYGLVVTNWHVVRDASGEITVVFPDGFRSAATVLKVDQDWDLAALMIWRPYAAPITIASMPPKPGDTLTIAGYGPGKYRSVTGRCTQYVAPGMNRPYEMVEVSVQAREGDSGGPILNDRGEMAGVLFGSGPGTTSGSHSGRVRVFLANVWPLFQLNDTRAGVASAPQRVQVPSQVHTPQRVHAPSRLQSPSQVHTPQRDQAPSRIQAPSQVHASQRVHEPQRIIDDNESPGNRLPSPTRAKPDVNESWTEPDDTDTFSRPIDLATMSEPPTVSASSLVLEQIVGRTPFDQAKTTLAAIGLLAIAMQLVNWLNGNGKS